MLEGWGLFLDRLNPLSSKTTKLVYKLSIGNERHGLLAANWRGPDDFDRKHQVRKDAVRASAALVRDGKIAAVYSWHDVQHAFAERNADGGLVSVSGTQVSASRSGACGTCSA